MEKGRQNTLRNKRRENTFTLQPDYSDTREYLYSYNIWNMLLPYGIMSTI